MKKSIVALLLAALFATAHAQQAPQAVRPELGVPLQAAQELAQAGKYAEALAKLREADAVPNLTPHEAFLIARLRGWSALGAGDTPTAMKAFEVMVDANELPSDEQQRTLAAMAGTAYQQKDYAQSIRWSERYLKAGGTSDETRLLLAQARYLNNDFAGAARDLTAMQRGDQAAGRKTPELNLKLLASSQQQANDMTGYRATLERLITTYPKKDYWTNLLTLTARDVASDRLQLDLYRLKAATIGLTDKDAVNAAQLAAQAGLPGEAKKLLGGRDAALGAHIERQLAGDKVGAAEENAARAARDGNALFNLGWALASSGQTERGLPMMEQGLAKGGLKRPDEARLHLGLTQALAGRKDDARQTLAAVGGKDGTAEIARLWALYAQAPAQ